MWLFVIVRKVAVTISCSLARIVEDEEDTCIMAFGLAIGTERAALLQVCFSDSFVAAQILMRASAFYSGWASETRIQSGRRYGRTSPLSEVFYWHLLDPVMAEYITIMLINNKTSGKSIRCSIVIQNADVCVNRANHRRARRLYVFLCFPFMYFYHLTLSSKVLGAGEYGMFIQNYSFGLNLY